MRESGTSSFFSLFIQARTPSHGMVFSIFRVSLPPSVKPLWQHPHRNNWKCAFRVIQNPTKLKIKANYHDVSGSCWFLLVPCLFVNVLHIHLVVYFHKWQDFSLFETLYHCSVCVHMCVCLCICACVYILCIMHYLQPFITDRYIERFWVLTIVNTTSVSMVVQGSPQILIPLPL